MINLIKYYYNFNELNKEEIIYKDKKYNIKYKNNNYILYEIINKEEIIESYNLCKNNNLIEPIILNIENNIFTNYKDKTYVLIKKINNNNVILFTNIINKKSILDRSLWDELWSLKIDYIENIMLKLRDKYKLIDESINYYIGMTESAISYYNYNINNLYTYKTLCRKRIIKDEMYNPLNIVVDNNMRDVAEYIKDIFWTNKKINIKNLINNLNLNYNNCILLISRLLYPSYYFDKLEAIINNLINVNVINDYIFRIDEYENYIYKVFLILKEKYQELPLIDWIKKCE